MAIVYVTISPSDDTNVCVVETLSAVLPVLMDRLRQPTDLPGRSALLTVS